jgi:hypothetical protein
MSWTAHSVVWCVSQYGKGTSFGRRGVMSFVASITRASSMPCSWQCDSNVVSCATGGKGGDEYTLLRPPPLARDFLALEEKYVVGTFFNGSFLGRHMCPFWEEEALPYLWRQVVDVCEELEPDLSKSAGDLSFSPSLSPSSDSLSKRAFQKKYMDSNEEIKCKTCT